MDFFNDNLDRIFEDALENPIHHEFSKKYQKRRNKIMSECKNKNRKSKRITFSVLAAAAAIAIVPLGVYAYNAITADVEQTATYQNTVKVTTPVEESSKTIEFMEFEFGYLPKGLELMGEDSPYEGKYKNANGGGMTPTFCVLGTYDFEKELPFSETSKKYETDNATIITNYRVSYDPETASPDNFGREVFVVMKEQPYIANLYFTDDISEDDVTKICEGLKLVPADELLYNMYIPPEVDEDAPTYIDTIIDFDKIYSSDETFELEYNKGISAKINNISFADNYDGITTDGAGFECDYSHLSGSLEDNMRTYINCGDGIYSLDEVIKEENVPLHIVSLEIEYTNNSDTEQDICVCPKLLISENDTFRYPMRTYEMNIDLEDSMTDTNDMGGHFAFESTSDASKNHVIVSPGETETAKLYFVVEKENIDKLYLAEFEGSVAAVKLGE